MNRGYSLLLQVTGSSSDHVCEVLAFVVWQGNQLERWAPVLREHMETRHQQSSLTQPMDGPGPGIVLLRNSDPAQGSLAMKSQPRNMLWPLSIWKHRKLASFKIFTQNHTALNHSSPDLPNIEDTSIL